MAPFAPTDLGNILTMEAPGDPAKPELSDHPDHMRDPRRGEREDPHAGYSDDPRVDPTPDHHQSS